MDASEYVRVAFEEFDAATAAAEADGPFSQRAETIRDHMRSATACLLRTAVVWGRQPRETVGQQTFNFPEQGSPGASAGVPRS